MWGIGSPIVLFLLRDCGRVRFGSDPSAGKMADRVDRADFTGVIVHNRIDAGAVVVQSCWWAGKDVLSPGASHVGAKAALV